jgi:acetoacetyl-CoA reductase
MTPSKPAPRIALVTGGTRGIGAAISEALQAAGCKVAANFASNVDAAREFEKRTKIPTYKFDVTDFDACGKAIAKLEKDLGGPVDILVNNAGITRDSTLRRMEPEQWHEVINTNLTSAFNLTRHIFPGMLERQFGRVINISSINGRKGQFGQSNYAAAKAGLIGFTKALALEGAAKGVTCNAIAPGYINTEMVAAIQPEVRELIIKQIPAGRLGQAEEIARAVVFLAADEAAFINGATLDVNGAQYLG